MITKELLSYVEGQTKEGVTKEQISKELLSAGWENLDIQEVFTSIEDKLNTTNVDVSEDISKIEKEAIAKELTLENTPEEFAKVGTSVEKYKPRHSSPDKSHAALFLFIVIALILVGSGGIFAYNKFFNKLTPYDVVMQMMAENISPLVSSKFSSDINLRLDVKDSNNESLANVNTTMGIKGSRDMVSAEKLNFDIQNKLDFSGSYSMFSIALKADWDIRLKDNLLYLRLNQLTNIPGFNIDSIKGKWISLTDLSSGVRSVAKQLDPTHTASLLDNKEFTKKEEKIKEAFDLKYREFLASDEAKEIINRSFTDGLDKKVDDVLVHHYIVKFSKEDIRIILNKAINIITEISEQEIDDIKEVNEIMKSKEFETFLGVFENSSLEIWIGKKDLLLYKTLMNIEFLDEKFPDQFTLPGLNSAREKGSQASMKDQMSSMRVEAELYYNDEGNNSYGNIAGLGICSVDNISNKTMFSSDESIVARIEAIRKLNDSDVYCVATGSGTKAQKYAVSAPYKDGYTSWCVDSSGFSGSGQASEDGTCKNGYVSVETNTTQKEVSVSGVITITFSLSDVGEPVRIETPKNVI